MPRKVKSKKSLFDDEEGGDFDLKVDDEYEKAYLEKKRKQHLQRSTIFSFFLFFPFLLSNHIFFSFFCLFFLFFFLFFLFLFSFFSSQIVEDQKRRKEPPPGFHHEESDTDSEEEDEDAALLSRNIQKEFLTIVPLIKNKDPAIYNKEKKAFFSTPKFPGQEGQGEEGREEKKKKYSLSDMIRDKAIEDVEKEENGGDSKRGDRNVDRFKYE